jgi:hypothetical protein
MFLLLALNLFYLAKTIKKAEEKTQLVCMNICISVMMLGQPTVARIQMHAPTCIDDMLQSHPKIIHRSIDRSIDASMGALSVRRDSCNMSICMFFGGG